MKQLKRDAPFRGKRKSFVFRFKNEKCCPGLTLIYCSSFCPSSIGEMTYKPRTKPNFDLYCHMMLFTPTIEPGKAGVAYREKLHLSRH